MAGRFEPITIYYTATGEIKSTSEKEYGVAPTLNAGEAYVNGTYDPDDFYIALPSLTPTARPSLLDLEDEETVNISVSAGVNQTIVSNMPIGTIVNGPMATYAVTTVVENLQVLAERSGEFPFEVLAPFPYKPLAFTLVIDDAN